MGSIQPYSSLTKSTTIAPGARYDSNLTSIRSRIAIMPNATVDRILSVKPAGKRGLAPKIRKLKTRYPELGNTAIARQVGCSINNVDQVLRRFLGKTSVDDLRNFQEAKADVYDALQLRALGSITQAKLSKAPVVALVTSAAILEDKARLVRGQATGINVNVLMDLAEVLRSRPATNPRAISDAIDVTKV